MMTEQATGTMKQFTMNVLNGLSMAILIALIPSALLGELTKAILPYFPSLQFILDATTIAMRLLPAIIGLAVAMQFGRSILEAGTIAIATAISLSGVAAGAANLGVVAAGFGLAIAGWQANATGTSIAHFLGSPKIQMANFVRRPIMMLPILANAAILGALAGILKIEGTPISAGFGVSGLIGPVNALHFMPGGFALFNVLLVIVLFGLIPVALGIFFYRVFERATLVKSDHYRLDFE